MAIAGFKYQSFMHAKDLQLFVSTGAVTTVVAITYDQATGWTVFYT